MYILLRPKLLLFFAISIMSAYVTSEKSYAIDALKIDGLVKMNFNLLSR